MDTQVRPRSVSLTLDEASHTYRMGAQVVPGVTQVLDAALQEYQHVATHVLEIAADFGRNVHAACDLYDRAELDWNTLDMRLAPYVTAWARFLDESGVTIIASELRVYHPRQRYAGTLDALGVFPRRRRPSVIDRKTTAVIPKSVGPQTAAYREARAAQGFELGTDRYCVHLRSDASYKLLKLAAPGDYPLFLSCLNVWRFKNGY